MVTMADGFVAFKDPDTGIVARYPEHYGDLFPHLEPVDESEVICVPCQIVGTEPEDDVDDEEFGAEGFEFKDEEGE